MAAGVALHSSAPGRAARVRLHRRRHLGRGRRVRGAEHGRAVAAAAARGGREQRHRAVDADPAAAGRHDRRPGARRSGSSTSRIDSTGHRRDPGRGSPAGRPGRARRRAAGRRVRHPPARPAQQGRRHPPARRTGRGRGATTGTGRYRAAAPGAVRSARRGRAGRGRRRRRGRGRPRPPRAGADGDRDAGRPRTSTAALHDLLADDAGAYLLGEDVARPVRRRVQGHQGPLRPGSRTGCCPRRSARAAIIGVAAGLALAGDTRDRRDHVRRLRRARLRPAGATSPPSR